MTREKLHDLLDAWRHRLEERKVQRGHLVPLAAHVLDGFLDRAARVAPADHQEIAFGITEHFRRLERFLECRELQAPHVHAELVDLRIAPRDSRDRAQAP